MIDVIVVGDVELIGEDEVIISIDGTECEEELKNLIEHELDNTLDDDVASTLMLKPVCRDVWGFVGISEGLNDDEFMEKITLCVEYNFSDMEDFLTMCKDMGFTTVTDVEQHYLGQFNTSKEFCEYFLEYELYQTDALITQNINWDTLYDDLSDDVYSIGRHYTRQH